MKKVSIYTDGACSGNPGKGGWGAVLVYNGTEKEMSGFEAETTNNRMELTAVIRALSLDEIDFSDLVAVVWKEIRVAVLCGVCLAAANFVKMMVVDRWLMHNPEVTPLVALVVCLTLVFTVLCAKVVGCTLPMAAEKLGIDPAVMASPFISTIVDALSLLIYFRFATWILGV